MKQTARNLTDGLDGFLSGYKYLIHDRAPCFSKAFRAILRGAGVKTIRLPRRSPNLNPFAERWVRTAKELCVDRMIFFGEISLRRAMAEVETFYNRERPHQGIGNTIILPEVDKPTKEGLSAAVGLGERSITTTEKRHETGGNRLLGPYRVGSASAMTSDYY